MAVARAALQLDLPILALCRGMQVLNIVLGGTLIQDIGNDEHWMREHSVKLVEGSIIADLVGDTHLDHCHSSTTKASVILVTGSCRSATPRTVSSRLWNCRRRRGS
jgi:putative glutamine amidotransferase